MTINIAKFGTVLSSRQAGKESHAAFLPTLNGLNGTEDVLVDFEGVISFSPSWGDEFLTPLRQQFGNRLKLKNITNPSVSLTIATLEKINGYTIKTV
ncbi:MAG: DUF4325 domain-containing protein [Patescibacteria group bacterium]